MQSIHAFAEKVAVVAGGAGQIGRAVSLQLALQGAFVIVLDGPGSEDFVARELQSLGTLAATYETDVSSAAGVDRAVGRIDETFGRIDLLVNCLSVADGADSDGFDAAAGAGLKAPYLLITRALRLMAERPKARIVTVVPAPAAGTDAVLHSIVRSGVEGLTRGFARALPPAFRVNAVVCGCGSGHDARPTGPDDVARAVMFLLSSESVGLNGQILFVS
jgi:3-oxoacyl-[acyl-carrier protein] reductase